MKAEEIRKIQADGGTITQQVILKEIAAQLAEISDTLKIIYKEKL